MVNYSETKRTAIGTELDDYIYAQEYYTPLSGKNEGKGFTIKGGDGNDEIWDTHGADTITGGSGTNIIYFNKESNPDCTYYFEDTVILSKNENLTVVYNKDAINEASYYYIDKYNKNNVGINITSYNGNYISILLKNMAKSDVANEVFFQIGTEKIDLKKYVYTDYAWSESYTGSWLNENINGYDDMNQKISAGAGNDIIDAGQCNDTITGGIGTNTIKYTNGDGNDIIVLTKDETAIIDLYEITKDQLNYSFTKNDLIISYVNNEEETQKITIKNFAKKDVVGENGSVYATFNGSEIGVGSEGNDYINLKTKIYEYNNFTDKKKSYTGTWLNEQIDATSLDDYTITNNNGVSINAKAGTNTILGSKYNDVIKGGSDNDTITSNGGDDKIYGGTGDNVFIFKKGDGADTVYSTKNANDTLDFGTVSYDNLKFTQDKNNLVITGYGEETDKVTVINYYKGESSIQNIIANGTTKSISNAINEQPTEETPESGGDIHTQPYDGSHIVGTNGNNKLNGTDNNDIIHGKLGSDTIYGKDGNDTIDAFIDAQIYGDDGNDYIHIQYGFSTIYGGKGDDYISASCMHNEIYAEDGNDTIYANSTNFVDAGKGNDVVELQGNYPEEGNIYLGDGNDSITIGGLVRFANVYGGSGEDTIEISGDNCKIYGGDGNDTYIQDGFGEGTTNIIYDASGDADSFTFQYGSYSDIDVFVNVYANGTYDSDLTLTSNYYANKKMIFKEYFNEGKIEKIYQSNHKISEIQLNTCIQEVASWLSDNGFESAQAVLDNGNETNINTLYAKFDNCWTY